MNHTQKELLRRADEIRDQERENATWGGPDPRGQSAASTQLELARELERIAALEEEGQTMTETMRQRT